MVTVNSYANHDYIIPKENCKKAVEVVLNKDFELFKTLYMPFESKHDKEAIQLINNKHDKYTKRRYTGINNFKIIKVTRIDDAKNNKYQSVRLNHEKYGYDTEIWVKYRFDSTSNNKAVNATGKCKFGLVDNNWYMINLLK